MYRSRPNPHGAGAKGYFKKKFVKDVYRLALLGASRIQIADFFEVSTATITYWVQRREDFAQALKKGKIHADSKVAEALYQRALGYSHPDTHIMTNRVKEYDADGNIIKEYSEPLIIPITKHYAPDTQACLKWLQLRQKENWSETINVNHSVQGSTHIDIKVVQEQLSDPEKYSTEDLEKALNLSVRHIKDQMHLEQHQN